MPSLLGCPIFVALYQTKLNLSTCNITRNKKYEKNTRMIEKSRIITMTYNNSFGDLNGNGVVHERRVSCARGLTENDQAT